MNRPKAWRAEPSRHRLYIAVAVVLLVLLVFFRWHSAERTDFGELPDFAGIEDVAAMKKAFYEYLTPIITHHNNSIRINRARLKALQKQGLVPGDLPQDEQRWLRELSARYELPWQTNTPPADLLRELLLRVDTIPLPLVLAQAAKESGWGRSRFAVEGNNLFGQWCYVEGCGIVPANRAAGAIHEAEAFSSVSESTRRYMNNLNTHERYREFRVLRAKIRKEGEPMTGMTLAKALLYYSERREEYVKEVRAMIRQFLRMPGRETST